jgi:hypothetical protein
MLATSPAKPFEYRRNAALVSSPDFRKLDMQTIAGDLQNRRLMLSRQEPVDRFFPGVGFVAGVLLWRDVLALEIAIGPPFGSLSKFLNRLSIRAPPLLPRKFAVVRAVTGALR